MSDTNEGGSPTQPSATTPPADQPPPTQPPPAPADQGVAAPGAPATEGGLDPKVGGLLSYLLFGWIGGLIMYLTQKDPRVRFHGAQSILFSIALIVLFIALGILGTIFALIPGVGFIGSIISLVLYPLLWLGSMVLWVILCIKGYALEQFKLPFIGDMAESWATK